MLDLKMDNGRQIKLLLIKYFKKALYLNCSDKVALHFFKTYGSKNVHTHTHKA